MLLMDTQQGFVYRGVYETVLHAQSNQLSAVAQGWNKMWHFTSRSFYTTLSVPSHFSVVACQASRFEHNTTADNHYDMLKLDLLSGSVFSASFVVKNASPLLQAGPTLHLDVEQTRVILYDPSLKTELYSLDLSTWLLPAAGTNANTFPKPHLGGWFDSKKSRVSRTRLVTYRDLFNEPFMPFQDTNGISFGVLHVAYARYSAGAWASSNSFFRCVCRPGHRPRGENLAGGASDGGCVLCSPLEPCSTTLFSTENTTKCAPG